MTAVAGPAPTVRPGDLVLLVDDMPQSLGALAQELEADGYTVLVTPSTLALNLWMYTKLPYDAIRDLAPLTQIAAVPNAPRSR